MGCRMNTGFLSNWCQSQFVPPAFAGQRQSVAPWHLGSVGDHGLAYGSGCCPYGSLHYARSEAQRYASLGGPCAASLHPRFAPIGRPGASAEGPPQGGSASARDASDRANGRLHPATGSHPQRGPCSALRGRAIGLSRDAQICSHIASPSSPDPVKYPG